MYAYEDYDDWFGGGADYSYNSFGGGGYDNGFGSGFLPAEFGASNPFTIGTSGGGPNGPFGGAPGGGIAINIGGGGVGGPKPPDVSETLTAIVNALEVRLQINLGKFQAAQLSADDAISNAWELMDRMVSECMRFGAEGQKAAAERDRRINPSMVRWDWVAYYIDPITGGGTALPPLPGGGVVVGVNPNGTPIYGPGNGSSVSAFRFDPVMLAIGGLLVILLLRKS